MLFSKEHLLLSGDKAIKMLRLVQAYGYKNINILPQTLSYCGLGEFSCEQDKYAKDGQEQRTELPGVFL